MSGRDTCKGWWYKQVYPQCMPAFIVKSSPFGKGAAVLGWRGSWSGKARLVSAGAREEGMRQGCLVVSTPGSFWEGSCTLGCPSGARCWAGWTVQKAPHPSLLWASQSWPAKEEKCEMSSILHLAFCHKRRNGKDR